jgi:hypothetical protein
MEGRSMEGGKPFSGPTPCIETLFDGVYEAERERDKDGSKRK